MSIIKSIRDFILTCPYLKEGALGVDYLGNMNGYTIEVSDASPILKRYADGGLLKQFVFLFASREEYGEDIQKNLDNRKFFEDFEGWIKSCNDSGQLPELCGGKSAQAIETLSDAAVPSGSAGSGRYQIKCRLIYYEGW